MSLFTGAAIIGAALAAGTASTVAANIGSNASDRAGDAASKSNAEALAFQRQQAENGYRNQETTRRANWEQHKAQVDATNRTRQALGLAPVAVPDYVPSVDPAFTGTPGGGPSIGAVAGAPPAMSAPPVETPQQRAAATLRAAPTSLQPRFLPMDGTLGQMAGAPMPNGSPWVGPTAQQLDDLRKRVQT